MRKRVKYIGMLSALIAVLGAFSPYIAEASELKFSIDGNTEYWSPDIYYGKYADEIPAPEYVIPEELVSYVKSGSTMVPLRTISESLGHHIQWDKATKTITIDENIIFKVGDKNASIKDANRVIKMDVPAEMKNGTTYVPIRFVSETLNHKVEYKKKGQVDRINIIKDYKTRFNSTKKDIDPSYFGKILNIDLKANEVYFKVLKFVNDDHSDPGYYVDDLKDLRLFRLAHNAEFYVIDFNIESDDASRKVTKEELSLQLSSFTLPNSTGTTFYTLETNGEEIVKVKAFYTP